MSYGGGQFPFWLKNQADNASARASHESSQRTQCEQELDKLKIKLKKLLEHLEKLHSEGKIDSDSLEILKNKLQEN